MKQHQYYISTKKDYLNRDIPILQCTDCNYWEETPPSRDWRITGLDWYLPPMPSFKCWGPTPKTKQVMELLRKHGIKPIGQTDYVKVPIIGQKALVGVRTSCIGWPVSYVYFSTLHLEAKNLVAEIVNWLAHIKILGRHFDLQKSLKYFDLDTKHSPPW